MPDRLAVRARSRRAFSSSDRFSFGTSFLESTSRCMVLSFMLYSHRSCWSWLSVRPRRKVTRAPSGDTFTVFTPGPASDGSPWMRSSVRRSAEAGAAASAAMRQRRRRIECLVEVSYMQRTRRYQSRTPKAVHTAPKTLWRPIVWSIGGGRGVLWMHSGTRLLARQALHRPGQQDGGNRQAQHEADPEARRFHRRRRRPREPGRRDTEDIAERQRKAPEGHQLDDHRRPRHLVAANGRGG